MKKNGFCRKITAVILSAAMVLGMTACGSDNAGTAGSAATAAKSGQAEESSAAKSSGTEETASAADTAAAKSEYQTTFGSKKFDDVTLTVEVFDRSNAPEGSTVIDNKWVDYINEKMSAVGIKIKFVAVPRSEEVDKVQTMMASGTGADIMLCYTNSIVEDFYNQGGTYDLAPYVDGADQAENLKKYLGEDCMNVARNKDGALWAIAARRSTTAVENVFIRNDWLKELGMQTPTTVDEMYSYLVGCKKNHPDITACWYDKDSALVSEMAMPFLKSVTDDDSWNIYGGSFATLMYGDEGMTEYYRWLNKLYNEGLMDPEFYSYNDNNATMNESIVSGKTASFEANVNYNVDSLRGEILQNLKQNDPNADIVSLAPLKNVNDGNTYNIGYSINGAFVFVPKTCKNPEAAVTYLDWLATQDGGFTLFHGIEGKNYKLEDGIPVVIDSDFNATDKDWIRHDLFLIGNQGYYMDENSFALATSKECPGYEDYVLQNYKNASAEKVCHQSVYTGPTYTEHSTDIGLVVDEYTTKCITCTEKEFDKNIADFKAALKENGIEDIIAERQSYFNSIK